MYGGRSSRWPVVSVMMGALDSWRMVLSWHPHSNLTALHVVLFQPRFPFYPSSKRARPEPGELPQATGCSYIVSSKAQARTDPLAIILVQFSSAP